MHSVEVRFGNQRKKITAADIRAAFHEFDERHRGKQADSGSDYVVVWRNRRYPPKKILALASKIPVGYFHGGHQTNSVFERLGFKPHQGRSYKDSERVRLERRCPSLSTLSNRLFNSQWQHMGSFDREGKAFTYADPRLRDNRYPGVYALAFDVKDLSGSPVTEDDVFYVGMSSIALATRLRQFRTAMQNGQGHSGGKRLFLKLPKEKASKRLFVAAVTIPCRFRKLERNASDLRKLGAVAALEWHILARVRDICGQEPPLNKK